MSEKPTVCFVDDDVNELKRFARAFGERFHVITGENAEECVEALRQQGRRCGLWVLDLYFPKPGVVNTAERRQEMNERFADLAAHQREFNMYLASVGQGSDGGLETMKRARALTPNVPVMFLTRKGTLADSVRCRAAGAADVTLKPMPAGSDASVEAFDQAMVDAADELGRRFERVMRPAEHTPKGISPVIVAVALIVGLIAGAMLGSQLF